MRQRDLHMTRHGGCQESAAHTTSRACACVLSALCCGWPREHVRTSHALRGSNVAWYGSSEPLVLRNHPPRAPHCDDSDGVCGLEVRGVAVETQSAVVHFGVCHARAWGSDVAWTSAGRVGARHVPMWRRGRPRRSASTTYRCAGSLRPDVSTGAGRARERISARVYRAEKRSNLESSLHFINSVIRARALYFRLATLLRPYRTSTTRVYVGGQAPIEPPGSCDDCDRRSYCSPVGSCVRKRPHKERIALCNAIGDHHIKFAPVLELDPQRSTLAKLCRADNLQ